MPRLIGKQSNKNGYIAVLLIATVTSAIVLEYSGLINLVPNFGREDVSLLRKQNVRKNSVIKIYRRNDNAQGN